MDVCAISLKVKCNMIEPVPGSGLCWPWWPNSLLLLRSILSIEATKTTKISRLNREVQSNRLMRFASEPHCI